MADNNTEIDFELIAKKCGLNEQNNISQTVQAIDALAKEYGDEELVNIYNYFLITCTNPDILAEVIRFGDKIRSRKSLPVLIDVLLGKITIAENIPKDNFINVRVMAAKAIANIKDTSPVNALLYCLNNKNENYKVRFACADALGKIGDKYAVAPLIDVVKDEDEKSVYLRESAASALGMLGDARAIDSLVGILETKNGLVDKFTFLKERVLEALGKLSATDNSRVFKALKKSLMDDSPQIRINAIEALMDSDKDEAYDLIKNCLKDADDEVKRNALIALYNMKGRTILDEVLANQNEYCDFLKTEALSIIEEYENGEDDEE